MHPSEEIPDKDDHKAFSIAFIAVMRASEYAKRSHVLQGLLSHGRLNLNSVLRTMAENGYALLACEFPCERVCFNMSPLVTVSVFLCRDVDEAFSGILVQAMCGWL